MRVTFLGSGDAFGSGGRLQACILLDTGVSRLLLDCGATSMVAMKRQGLEALTLDAVILTHLHGDHFGGLPFMILDAQFRRRTQPLAVAGPTGVEKRVTDAMEILFPGSTHVERRFGVEYVELENRRVASVAAASITPYEVVHPSGAPPLALRIAADKTVIAYSGDTEWTDALLDVARGADLFICEAYTFEKRVKYHLDYRTLEGHRNALGCKRLILTHMGPEMLAHAADAAADCAWDGLTIEV